MTKKTVKYLKNADGSILMMFVILFIFFLVIGVIAVDIGMAVVEKSKITTAADAGALAGVYEFLNKENITDEDLRSALEKQGKKFFYQNYFGDLEDFDWDTDLAQLEDRALRDFGIRLEFSEEDISLEEKFITLRPQRTRVSFFARVFGVDSFQSQGYARAQAGFLSGYTGIKPFGLPLRMNGDAENKYQPGETVTLKIGDDQKKNDSSDIIYQGPGAGNWQLLRSPSNENVRDLIVYGISDFEYTINYTTDQIEGELDTATGQKVGQIKQGIEELQAMCEVNCSQDCSVENHDPDCPLLAVVPIVDYGVIINGRSTVRVVGFATIYITGYDNSTKAITGTFVEYTPVANFKLSPYAPDYGTGGILLIE
jgi:hypothetical protein